MWEDLIRHRDNEDHRSVEQENYSEPTRNDSELGSKGNTKAFEKIMQVLVAHNYTRTIKQRQDKIKSLNHYKDVIDRNMNSGAVALFKEWHNHR